MKTLTPVGMMLMSLATAALVFAVLRFAPTIRQRVAKEDSVNSRTIGNEGWGEVRGE